VSRGPGVWQRSVLLACSAECSDWLSVEAIAGARFALSVDPKPGWRITASEREAIRRAIRILARKGKILSRHNERGELEAADVRLATPVNWDALVRWGPGDSL